MKTDEIYNNIRGIWITKINIRSKFNTDNWTIYETANELPN
jgi:hypothetical protein